MKIFNRLQSLYKVYIYIPLLLLVVTGCKKELLVECESFENRGGWVVDPQFSGQMGSPYLMAHGLGEPVENASTKIKIPASRTYHIWSRTRDWVPGPWEAPGRFHIIVDGKTLEKTMGNHMGWGWNYAGKTKLRAGEVMLELEDLTGFNGRCDAIYLCNRYRTPTNQDIYLSEWRERLTGNEIETRDFDLVVVGGGIAGCAATIAAAEQGLHVALIHDRPVLGGNASSEIRVHTLGIYGHFERILRMLDTEHYPNGSPEAVEDEQKRHLKMESYDRIELFLDHRAFAADTGGNRILSVDARRNTGGKRIRFRAPLFMDCTGDGWIGYWAGAEVMYGRESDSAYDESWEEHGERWSPEKPDSMVLGASLLWRSFEDDSSSVFPEVPWGLKVAADHAARQGTWQWELISNRWHQADQAEQIRDHMLQAIFGSFYNEKQKAGTENLRLEWVSFVLGKRESRRLTGDYIYTFNDMRLNRSFPDSVVVEEREVDVHYRQDELDKAMPDFLTEAMYYPAGRYYIPYRSLYSKNIENLFMAGRCFSCSHIGLGGPRVMRTTGQMGAAAGYAASLCLLHDCTPREIYLDHLDEYMQLVLHSNID